jgi:hypothetical protein
MLSVIDCGLNIPYHGTLSFPHKTLAKDANWVALASIDKRAIYVMRYSIAEEISENRVQVHSKAIFEYLSKLGRRDDTESFVGSILPISADVLRSKILLFFLNKKKCFFVKSYLPGGKNRV